VTVRKQDFVDDAGFDLAFLPAPFIPQPALHAGLPRVAAALRPGGWLMAGHGKFGGTPVQDALTRLKTIAYGGTPLDEAAACAGLPGTMRRIADITRTCTPQCVTLRGPGDWAALPGYR
jgi:hypothetical protein